MRSALVLLVLSSPALAVEPITSVHAQSCVFVEPLPVDPLVLPDCEGFSFVDEKAVGAEVEFGGAGADVPVADGFSGQRRVSGSGRARFLNGNAAIEIDVEDYDGGGVGPIHMGVIVNARSREVFRPTAAGDLAITMRTSRDSSYLEDTVHLRRFTIFKNDVVASSTLAEMPANVETVPLPAVSAVPGDGIAVDVELIAWAANECLGPEVCDQPAISSAIDASYSLQTLTWTSGGVDVAGATLGAVSCTTYTINGSTTPPALDCVPPSSEGEGEGEAAGEGEGEAAGEGEGETGTGEGEGEAAGEGEGEAAGEGEAEPSEGLVFSGNRWEFKGGRRDGPEITVENTGDQTVTFRAPVFVEPDAPTHWSVVVPVEGTAARRRRRPPARASSRERRWHG